MGAQPDMPDFLGIGGTRCGTTWLHDMLRRHPELWLPPIKELHYFDRSPAYASPSHLAGDRLGDRLFGRAPEQAQWRRTAGRHLLGAPRHPTTLAWKGRYYLGRPSDSWYASLFPPGGRLVRGEITPAYSLLSRADVERVAALMPAAKILFLLRDPVERAWSGYRRRGLTPDQVRARLARPVDRRGDYLTAIARWGGAFPRGQLHVDFYDDIAADPAGLLMRVFRFLGVAESVRLAGDVTIAHRVNAAPPAPMPLEVRAALTRRHLPTIEGLADMFGGPASRWLAVAEEVLAARP